jgi:hypothetical protein
MPFYLNASETVVMNSSDLKMVGGKNRLLPKRDKKQTLIVIPWEYRQTGTKNQNKTVSSEDYDLRYGLDTPVLVF